MLWPCAEAAAARCPGAGVTHRVSVRGSGISVDVLSRCLVSMVRTAPLLDRIDSDWRDGQVGGVPDAAEHLAVGDAGGDEVGVVAARPGRSW